MAAASSLVFPAVPSTKEDHRFLLEGVSWATYVMLSDGLFAAGSRLRLTYLRGALELMGFGSATFREEARERGVEPDECYKLGPLASGGVPDIALEIVVSRWLIDKLDVYAGLGVREVWVYAPKEKRLEIYVLEKNGFERRPRSAALPALDLDLLARHVRPGENQTRLVRAHRAALAKKPRRKKRQ